MCKKKKTEKCEKNEAQISVLSDEKSSGGVIIPSENVLFVGGQENFINKMKKLYPGWTFLESGERNCKKVNGEYDLAIIKANHCSHNIIERALAHVGNVPIIYSNCTNVDRTIDEIKLGIETKGLRFKMCENATYFGNYSAVEIDGYNDFLENLIRSA